MFKLLPGVIYNVDIKLLPPLGLCRGAHAPQRPLRSRPRDMLRRHLRVLAAGPNSGRASDVEVQLPGVNALASVLRLLPLLVFPTHTLFDAATWRSTLSLACKIVFGLGALALMIANLDALLLRLMTR